MLLNNGLLHDYTATKDSILDVYKEIKSDYEKTLFKKPIVRYVDFNQGMDARLATPERISKLAKINICQCYKIGERIWDSPYVKLSSL